MLKISKKFLVCLLILFVVSCQHGSKYSNGDIGSETAQSYTWTDSNTPIDLSDQIKEKYVSTLRLEDNHLLMTTEDLINDFPGDLVTKRLISYDVENGKFHTLYEEVGKKRIRDAMVYNDKIVMITYRLDSTQKESPLVYEFLQMDPKSKEIEVIHQGKLISLWDAPSLHYYEGNVYYLCQHYTCNDQGEEYGKHLALKCWDGKVLKEVFSQDFLLETLVQEEQPESLFDFRLHPSRKCLSFFTVGNDQSTIYWYTNKTGIQNLKIPYEIANLVAIDDHLSFIVANKTDKSICAKVLDINTKKIYDDKRLADIAREQPLEESLICVMNTSRTYANYLPSYHRKFAKISINNNHTTCATLLDVGMHNFDSTAYVYPLDKKNVLIVYFNDDQGRGKLFLKIRQIK